MAKKEETTQAAVAVQEHPQELTTVSEMDQLFHDDTGLGMAGVGAGDYAIPFLTIMQKGSPQVSKANAKYVKGAEVGQIFNTVTNKLHDGDAGILFIPCGFQKACVRWKSRDSGGGLVCSYKENDPILKTFKRDERGRMYDEKTKDIVVDTCYHFGVEPLEGGFPELAVISMWSTNLKVSRNWNTVIRRIMKKAPNGAVYNPPPFSHVYRVKTIPQTKDTYDWYAFSVISESEVSDIGLYKFCRDFAKEVDAGNVRISAPPQDFDESESSDEIPF